MELAIGLGVGLGIGIPSCLVGAYYYYRYYIIAHIPFIDMTEFLSKLELSDSARNDFIKGNLSKLLKDELMVCRLKTGRYLTEFTEYATYLGHKDIYTFCHTLNPVEFPIEIFHKVSKNSVSDKPTHRYCHI